MTVKAELSIVLKANEVVVAESNDANLWQRVLAAIQGAASAAPFIEDEVSVSVEDIGGDAIDRFVKYLGATREQVVGACDPSTEAPYIHLDNHHWEDFRKNMPARGANAVNVSVLALTLLVLWRTNANLEPPTVRDAAAVRDTIAVDDKNAGRSIANCEWLQERNGVVRLNPSQTSKAIAVARAYCLRTSVSGRT